MKCGQNLPDDALFCSSCGTKTPLGQNTYKKEPIKNIIENEELQIAKEQAEKERKEKITRSNKETRKTLSDALENAKQAKTTRVIIFGIIAGISALIALISISSIFSGQELTVELLMTAFMSFAVALGVLCGTGIVCHQFNQIIQEKETELKRFDDEIKTNKEDF